MTDLGIEFTPYNFYAGWAKQVFVKREYKEFDNPDAQPNKYPSVYGVGITPDDEKKVHLVFVGTTNFAVAFAMEAAHVLHFPNFHSKGVKTIITFIDKNADKEKLRNIIQEGLISDMSTDSFKEAMEIAISEKYGRKIENSPAYKEFVEFYIAMAKKERMFTLNQAIDEYKLEKQDDNKTIQEQG